jgi:hypothetical protein
MIRGLPWDGEWPKPSLCFDGSIPGDEFDMLWTVMKPAVGLSGFGGEALIRFREDGEPDTDATTSWTVRDFYRQPSITFTPLAFERGLDAVGVSFTHELIHCRQGFWRILWEKLCWLPPWRKGFPPHEVEAYDAVNLWYDYRNRSGARTGEA